MKSKPQIALFALFAILSGLGPGGGLLRAEELDREFYNDYLDSLPSEAVRRKKTLERNLLRVMKRVIPREDSQKGPAFVRKLKAADLKYKRATLKSQFVRGIFNEIRYLKPTGHMWLVKAERYLLFVSFKVDPRVFVVAEFQTKLVIKKRKKPGPAPTR